MAVTQRMAYRQMAGALASIGLIVGAWVALSPVEVVAPNADGRCGPPLTRLAAQERVEDVNAQRIIDRCEDLAADRMTIAGAAVAAGLVGFVAARGVGRRRVHLARERRRQERARAERDAREDRARQAAADAQQRADERASALQPTRSDRGQVSS